MLGGGSKPEVWLIEVVGLRLKGRCGRSLQRHLVYYHFLIQIYFKMRLSTNNVVSIM